MNNKKAIICTIMFAVLLVATWLVSHLVPPSPSGAVLGELLTYAVAGSFLGTVVLRFYRWLVSEDKE